MFGAAGDADVYFAVGGDGDIAVLVADGFIAIGGFAPFGNGFEIERRGDRGEDKAVEFADNRDNPRYALLGIE